MSVAYVDSSSLVAMAFNEPGGVEVRDRLNELTSLVSSNLLEAELRSVHRRHGRPFVFGLVANVDWVLPTRSLSVEFEAVLSAGYVRGADLWHLACALYIAHRPSELAFVTLDQRQRDVAHAIGFAT